MKLLCAADLHLGRCSSRLPDDAERARFSSAAAFARLVQLAVQQRVDAVLLAGDVVDRENRFFEAFGPLHEGLRTLSRENIPAIAIAGNHDFDVLDRLTTQFDDQLNFTLLGAGGCWQRHTLRNERGEALLHIDGWSFPSEHVLQSPLDSYDLQPPTDAPLVAMVHGDLDQPVSRYAPLATSRLRAIPAAAWLLGHVHQPMLRHADEQGSPALIYPGSPQALDPGEAGPHGVVLVSIDPSRRAVATALPLSTARYERWAIALDGCEAEADIRPHVMAAIRKRAALIAPDDGCELLSVRLTLEGVTSLSGKVAQLLHQELVGEAVPVGAAQLVVEKVSDMTAPPIDLDELARGAGPVATLAGWLKKIDQAHPDEDDAVAELLEAAAQKLQAVCSLAHYQGIDPASEGGLDEAATPAPQIARKALHLQMYRLMQQLRTQDNQQQSGRTR